MKKALTVLLLIIFTSSAVLAEQATKTIDSFAGVPWDTGYLDSMEIYIQDHIDTIDSHDIDFQVPDSEIAIKNQTVSNYSCTSYFYFDDNGLMFGLYQISEKHTNDNLYVEDFKKLNDVYVEVYGEGEGLKEIWSNDLFQGDKGYEGFSVKQGYLKYKHKWEDENGAYILHSLSGDNNVIDHSVYYVSARYAKELASGKKNTDGV